MLWSWVKKIRVTNWLFYTCRRHVFTFVGFIVGFLHIQQKLQNIQDRLSELQVQTKIKGECIPLDDLLKFRADVEAIVRTLPPEYQERFHPILQNETSAEEQGRTTVCKVISNGTKTGNSVVECEQMMSDSISVYGEDVLNKLQSKLKENSVHLNVTRWKGSRAGTVPVLLFCAMVTRTIADARKDLEGIGGNRDVILIMMHHIQNRPPLPNRDSREVIHDHGLGTNIRHVVDILFYEGVGVYDCAQNKSAINSLANVFKQIK